MRSGTSFYNPALGKKTALRFWPIWALYGAIWLIAMPLTLLRQAQEYGAERVARMMAQDVMQSYAAAAVVLAFVFGALAAMAVCSHLYSARSANFMAALPPKRGGQFFTHYLTGLGFLIVPNAVVWVLTAAVLGGCGADFAGLAQWGAVAGAACLFFYTFAFLCGMLTGHLLALPAFYLIFNFLAMGLMWVLNVILEQYFYGFSSMGAGVSTAVNWLTPVYQMFNVAVRDVRVMYWHETFWVYTAVAVAMAVCAWALYRARPMERAGDVVAWRGLRPVFVCGVAICAGLCLGYLTCLFLGEGAVIPAMLVWALAGYFAAQMLLEKSFRVGKRWKGAVAVAAVFCVGFAVVGFDLTGYETRVPDPDRVAAVEITGLNSYPYDTASWADATLTDPEAIAKVTRLHQAAVEMQADSSWRWGDSETWSSSFRVTYTLKNGRTMTRRYDIGDRQANVNVPGTVACAAQALVNDPAYGWAVYEFDQIEEFLAGGGGAQSAEFRTESYNAGQAAALYGAVKEDFAAGTIGARSLWDDPSDASVTTQIAPDGEVYETGDFLVITFSREEAGGTFYHELRIYVPPEAAATRALLARYQES